MAQQRKTPDPSQQQQKPQAPKQQQHEQGQQRGQATPGQRERQPDISRDPGDSSAQDRMPRESSQDDRNRYSGGRSGND